VAVLQDGRITVVGTHTELLAVNEHYRYVLASLDDEPRDLDSELDDDFENDFEETIA
jgi:ATP-binding cassette subfamily B protein